jgi:hypothetical protein
MTGPRAPSALTFACKEEVMSTVRFDRSKAPRTLSSERAEALAERLEKGVRDLAIFAATLTPQEWSARLPHDGRKVGVVVHHVASVYPVEIQLAQAMAAGTVITGVTAADINKMNASHAQQFDLVSQEDALDLLRINSAAAAAAIRKLSDEDLDSAVPVSLYSDAILTCQFMLEDHAVRHSSHHLAGIRAALKR